MAEKQQSLSGDAPAKHDGVKAHDLAKKQRDIGVAEFFARNKHLLGFDNARKALLTTVKEAVDNSIDACEEADVLPEIIVEVIDMGKDRFRVIVEDNGPGIVKAQIPKIFAKLLYGSKFHSMKQQRGQQGIGISASVMYAQLTTGRSAKITSRIGPKHPAHYYELQIDTAKNAPKIVVETEKEWVKDQGTRIEMDLEGAYQKGQQSIDEYIKETAVVNPHVTLIYVNPKAEQFVFTRVTNTKPVEAKEIKPHPYGVELGVLMKMLQDTEFKTIQQFLQNEFSRVSPTVAKEICSNARMQTKDKPQKFGRDQVEALIKGIKDTKIMAPPTDCLSPIGAELLEKGLKKEINAEFFTAVTRSPVVYKGNPFQIEVALAWGGDQPGDKPAKLMRFANRVPLLYQQGACGTTKAVTSTNWKSYGMQQSSGNLPLGPLTIAVHIASVWVPFTSESKEAIAHYEDILKEIRLALQEAGRELGKYVAKKQRVKHEMKKRSYIQKYIPKLAEATALILNLKPEDIAIMEAQLEKMLEKQRGKLDTMEFDPSKNEEFDEEFASIGKVSKKKRGEDGADDSDDEDSGDDYGQD